MVRWEGRERWCSEHNDDPVNDVIMMSSAGATDSRVIKMMSTTLWEELVGRRLLKVDAEHDVTFCCGFSVCSCTGCAFSSDGYR